MKIYSSFDAPSLRRSVENGTLEQRKAVLDILEEVRNSGDEALYFFTNKFDGVSLSTLKVTDKEIAEAYERVDNTLIGIMREAAQNIQEYHEKQQKTSWMMTRPDGTILGQKVTPLDSVGVYVPGGTAAYPSSVLMTVVPAVVAGVERIVMVSPPQKDGALNASVLVAAKEAGVTEIYKVGGAQAIAALAYGTKSIKPVDKIVGPGNIYVALAKREVFGIVDIDMIAGPSEIVVLADETANAHEVAADLLSQAEHDPRSSCCLVTASQSLAEAVQKEVELQLQTLPRKEIARASIDEYGAIYVTENLEEAIKVVNELAPEHLEIIVEKAQESLAKIKHAGAIFVGRYSSEPVGDYFAGTNHVLPTNGTARFSSPLNLDDYQKKSSVILYSDAAFKENASKIAAFARSEGLEAHARAIESRFKEEM
ncbi:histidinol dehydrogenase [Bacillus oleivorans]|uniref:Histidinol dehydrogenase n=1 Tax=Bacillus oleivorans TaxID=1448271 RepID=A0A285CZX7_9BACI|nr:histidinol dehydrogenase [Bacillus oleivorans]SNX72606.1 histidinol dehydrogenase [Bacillus oleivorans]